MINVREVICEAASDGLSPELAANMLLEPSRWEKRLFDPARDLATVYKQYLRGELGVGVLADAVQNVLAASNDMSDLADEVIKTYGTDATPGDVPDEAAVDTTPEDEQVEVLVRQDDAFVKQIVDHIRGRWAPELLEELYEQIGPARQAWQLAGAPETPEHPSWQQPEKPSFPQPQQAKPSFQQKQLRPDTLQAFESGKFFDNAAQSAREVLQTRKQIAQLYKARQWPELAQVYQGGGTLDQNLAALAGDLMVLRDITTAAVRGGYGNRPVGGMGVVPTARAFVAAEAWEPALLDPELGQAVTGLLKTLDAAQKGNLTYSQLQQQVKPYTTPTSPIYRFSNRGTARSPVQAPFVYDQKNAQKMIRQAVTQPSPVVAPEEELPAPPPEEEPEIQFADSPPPEQQPPAPQRAVAQAAAGGDLDDILSGGEIPGVDVEGTFTGILGLQPDRAGKFAAWLRSKGFDPEEIAGLLRDAYGGLYTLGVAPSSMQKFKGEPHYVRAQKAMQKYLKSKLDKGEKPTTIDLLQAANKYLSSI